MQSSWITSGYSLGLLQCHIPAFFPAPTNPSFLVSNSTCFSWHGRDQFMNSKLKEQAEIVTLFCVINPLLPQPCLSNLTSWTALLKITLGISFYPSHISCNSVRLGHGVLRGTKRKGKKSWSVSPHSQDQMEKRVEKKQTNKKTDKTQSQLLRATVMAKFSSSDSYNCSKLFS